MLVEIDEGFALRAEDIFRLRCVDNYLQIDSIDPYKGITRFDSHKFESAEQSSAAYRRIMKLIGPPQVDLAESGDPA